MLLGIDRLDYTKGLRQRLRAFGELISDGSLHVDDAVFVQVATPSRERVDQYKILRDDINRLVGRINGDVAPHRPAAGHLPARVLPARARWPRSTAPPTSWSSRRCATA